MISPTLLPSLNEVKGRIKGMGRRLKFLERFDMKTQVYTKADVLSAPVDSDVALLEPGYAGDVSPEQANWIRRHLKRSLTLAKWWGFSKKPRRATHAIMRVAMDGDPDDVSVNQQLVKGG